MNRKILHLDLDAFFCAVEELRDPSLAGAPFAVGGRAEERGVVASCSYAARRFGIHSAMPMARAMRLCPGLRVIPARHGVYSTHSRQVMGYLHALTPLVEQVSIDEAYLEVSDLPESGETLARRLQAAIRQDLRLPCSLGVATNKLVAKIATDVGKHAAVHKDGPPGPPCAVTIVPPGQEAAFLAPLPVEALPGIGPKTAAQLEALGVRTLGELAAWPASELVRRFGKHGQDISEGARGLDNRPLVIVHEAKSISQETTFAQDVRDEKLLRRTLQELCDGIAGRLRKEHLAGNTVRLKLRWPDFTTLSRQSTLPMPIDQRGPLVTAALELFEKNWRPGQAIRLLGVGISGLGPPVRQLSLWDIQAPSGSERERRLQAAVDELRQRFGKQAVRLGTIGGEAAPDPLRKKGSG